MALPDTTGTVLLAALQISPQVDVDVVTRAGVTTITRWDAAAAQPTEQQINNWATDASPLPASAGDYSGRLFSEWVADHGGDPNLTKRRVAKETYDGDTEAIYRALVLVLLDEINILRAAVNPPLPARTKTQARAAILAKLDSGDADSG